jgi:hypothetical protein
MNTCLRCHQWSRGLVLLVLTGPGPNLCGRSLQPGLREPLVNAEQVTQRYTCVCLFVSVDIVLPTALPTAKIAFA